MLRGLYGFVAKYVLSMVIVGLGIGVVYREITKAYLSGFPLEEQIIASFYLSLMHGHVFLVGVVIPSVLLLITYISHKSGLIDQRKV
ncbi:MAG: hypothetical protein DRO18_00565 [Thermoprotei archaeon]|nr:MAG: hypothetical protein DRO18_00565 [Thermoprotei archaeon]